MDAFSEQSDRVTSHHRHLWGKTPCENPCCLYKTDTALLWEQ